MGDGIWTVGESGGREAGRSAASAEGFRVIHNRALNGSSRRYRVIRILHHPLIVDR